MHVGFRVLRAGPCSRAVFLGSVTSGRQLELEFCVQYSGNNKKRLCLCRELLTALYQAYHHAQTTPIMPSFSNLDPDFCLRAVRLLRRGKDSNTASGCICALLCNLIRSSGGVLTTKADVPLPFDSLDALLSAGIISVRPLQLPALNVTHIVR